MKRFFLAAVVLLLAVQAEAEVKLPALLGSNMVLQRNTEVNFWGEASPRSRVLLTASWDGRTYDAKADAEGRWAMKIATGETVSDGKEVVLDNVMLGEVWVCSGQSNMEMPVSGFMFQPVEGAVDAIADAGMYPGIRMFTVPRVSSKTPLDDCDAAWQTATPASVGQFSAVGYFFGRMLYKALGIPVGLILPPASIQPGSRVGDIAPALPGPLVCCLLLRQRSGHLPAKVHIRGQLPPGLHGILLVLLFRVRRPEAVKQHRRLGPLGGYRGFVIIFFCYYLLLLRWVFR